MKLIETLLNLIDIQDFIVIAVTLLSIYIRSQSEVKNLLSESLSAYGEVGC